MKSLFNKYTQLLLILVITLGVSSIHSLTTGCAGGQIPYGEAPPASIDESSLLGEGANDTPNIQTVGDIDIPIDASVLIESPVEHVIPPEEVSCPIMQEPFGGKGLSILRGDEPCEEFTAVNIDTAFLYPELFNKLTIEMANFVAQERGATETTEDDREMVERILSKTKELDICRLPKEDERLSEMDRSEDVKQLISTAHVSKLSSGRIMSSSPAIILAIARDNANLKEALSDDKSEATREVAESEGEAPQRTLEAEKDVLSTRITGTDSPNIIITEKYFAIGNRTAIDNIRNSSSQSMEEALSEDFKQTPETNLIRSFRRVIPSKDDEESYEVYGMIPEKILEIGGVSASSNNVCEESAVRINNDSSLFQRKIEVTEFTSGATNYIINSLALIKDSDAMEEVTSEDTEKVREFSDELRFSPQTLVREIPSEKLSPEDVIEAPSEELSPEELEEEPAEEQQLQETLDLLR